MLKYHLTPVFSIYDSRCVKLIFVDIPLQDTYRKERPGLTDMEKGKEISEDPSAFQFWYTAKMKD